MTIRRAEPKELPEILAIYRTAREFMKQNGNPTQWGDSRPSEAAVQRDIETGTSYVLTDENGIEGVFCFKQEPDPTYAEISGGAWLNDEPYGVIHRAAGAGKTKGVMREILTWCGTQTDNLRIDTHENNKVMRHILTANGFTACGCIITDDGTPRIAFQRYTGPAEER